MRSNTILFFRTMRVLLEWPGMDGILALVIPGILVSDIFSSRTELIREK